MKNIGSELSEKTGQLKMPTLGGKMRSTNVADTEFNSNWGTICTPLQMIYFKRVNISRL